MEERFYDLAEQSLTRHTPVDSEFLTPEETAEFLRIAPNLAYADPHLFEDDWERKIVRFGTGAPDVRLLRIRSKAHGFVSLTHRDYLGSLLGLGLERKVVGDIIVTGDGAYVYVLSRIADFILQSLQTVGRANVEVTVCEELPEEARPRRQREEVVVSSLRLDRFCSTVFHLGRAVAQEGVAEGLVSVNGATEKRPAHGLAEGDRVSFRRKGKVQFVQVLRETAKGSLVLEIARYL